MSLLDTVNKDLKTRSIRQVFNGFYFNLLLSKPITERKLKWKRYQLLEPINILVMDFYYHVLISSKTERLEIEYYKFFKLFPLGN